MGKTAFSKALVAAALFGTATPFSKTLLDSLQENLLAGLLYLGAAILLLPRVVFLIRKGSVFFPRDAANRRRLVGAIFFGGMVGPVLLLVGLKQAMAASVSMWLNLETVATSILAYLIFREHIGGWTWLGNLGVLAAGLLLSATAGGWAGWIGIACVGGAAVAWGLDNNFTATIDGITPEMSTFWKGAFAGTANLALGLALQPTAPALNWLAALVLGGFAYGLSIVLYISSAQVIGATRSQMVFASAPFFGVLLSVTWLGERLRVAQLAAAGILLASLGLMFLGRHPHEHVHELHTHEHSHRHDDAHHDHLHEGLPAGAKHSHVHTHERVVHNHPHWPDLHHRHVH
ncbi:MAG: DMT family transporter [Verrucomicrobia bacterium]|nr:DMT family transporter [Verrucomicrobiota bacterium]